MRVMTAQDPPHHESDACVNSQESAVVSDDGADDVHVSRIDKEDHDLLTFGEAGARLLEEVIKQERVVLRLQEGHADAEVVAGAERRLESLKKAASRNSAPTIDDLKSSGFFGPR